MGPGHPQPRLHVRGGDRVFHHHCSHGVQVLHQSEVRDSGRGLASCADALSSSRNDVGGESLRDQLRASAQGARRGHNFDNLRLSIFRRTFGKTGRNLRELRTSKVADIRNIRRHVFPGSSRCRRAVPVC